MPNTKTRVVGSGFTTFNYRGKPIAFLKNIQDSGQPPVASPQSIHPLDQRHPVEIATARAVGAGYLQVTIMELWNAPVWQQLAGLEGTADVVSVYERLAAEPSEVSCQMIIKPPGANFWRGKTYHNCIVTEIDDTESIMIEALTVAKTMTIYYTHITPLSIAAA